MISYYQNFKWALTILSIISTAPFPSPSAPSISSITYIRFDCDHLKKIIISKIKSGLLPSTWAWSHP